MTRLAFVGDVMLGRLVSERLRAGLKAEQCWGDLAPLLQASDGVIGNLECALTTSRVPWLRTPKAFHFRADPQAVDVLKAGNICAVCLANNHVLDFEVAGLLDTLDSLERAGIAHAGAGRTRQQAFAAARFCRGNLAIALFGVTDNEPAFEAEEGRAGTAYVDLNLPVPTPSPTAEDVQKLRRTGAELIVLSCHLGPNMVLTPSSEIRRYRRILARNGIDVLHGHSAHVVQGIEQVENSVIMHDTGDMLDDYAVDPIFRNDWSFVFLLDIDARCIRRIQLIPVELGLAQVHLARVNVADAICRRMMAQCAAMGTVLTRTERGLELVVAS